MHSHLAMLSALACLQSDGSRCALRRSRNCWRRLDDKRASRISVSVPGGWADESTWPTATEQAVAAMQRLYAALAPAVRELRVG